MWLAAASSSSPSLLMPQCTAEWPAASPRGALVHITPSALCSVASCLAPRRTRAHQAFVGSRPRLSPSATSALACCRSDLLGSRLPCPSACSCCSRLRVMSTVALSFRHLRPRRCCRSDLLGGRLPCPSACSCCSRLRVMSTVALSFRHLRPRGCCRSDLLGGRLPCPSA